MALNESVEVKWFYILDLFQQINSYLTTSVVVYSLAIGQTVHYYYLVILDQDGVHFSPIYIASYRGPNIYNGDRVHLHTFATRGH